MNNPSNLDRAYGRLRTSLAKLMMACSFSNSEDPAAAEAVADALDERLGQIMTAVALLRHEARRGAAGVSADKLGYETNLSGFEYRPTRGPVEQPDGAGL